MFGQFSNIIFCDILKIIMRNIITRKTYLLKSLCLSNSANSTPSANDSYYLSAFITLFFCIIIILLKFLRMHFADNYDRDFQLNRAKNT